MFWVETIKNKYKFCTCEGAWSFFRIINADVKDELLQVYFTPLDGNRSLVFSLRKGEAFPSKLSYNFIFKPFQHVRIQVYGGDVTIVGESLDGIKIQRNLNHFPSNCPFGDEDDWKRKEKLNKESEEVNKERIGEEMIGMSSEDFEKEIENMKQRMKNS